ncbi:MAG: methyltransferase domain-containing protein [Opitutus sp.]|nr:methyltransferase domain-containing protein [Opitutus sp.]
MAHSVSGHLKLRVAEYDDLIRKLVPAYPAMRPEQLDLLALGLPASGGRVLDLGGGTGALAAALAERFPTAEVEIRDTDRDMLAVAQERCAPFGARVRYVQRSYHGTPAGLRCGGGVHRAAPREGHGHQGRDLPEYIRGATAWGNFRERRHRSGCGTKTETPCVSGVGKIDGGARDRRATGVCALCELGARGLLSAADHRAATAGRGGLRRAGMLLARSGRGRVRRHEAGLRERKAARHASGGNSRRLGARRSAFAGSQLSQRP